MSLRFYLVLLFLASLSYTQVKLEHIDTYSDGISEYNDIWGYVKDGKDYVMIGKARKYGVLIYEIQDDGTASLIVNYDGEYHGGSWSEPRYYSANGKEYVYLPTDASRASDGLSATIIIDITDKNNIVKVNEFGTRSHNIFLDGSRLYTCGSNSSSRNAVECWDLSDPENPVRIWSLGSFYVHDMFIKNNKLYLAEIYNSTFAIYDISTTPNDDSFLSESQLIIRHHYDNGFTHHICPSEDENYIVVSDEHSQFDHIQLWDIRNISNVKNLWKHQEGQQSIVHNSFIKDDYIFSSYYDRGLVIFDISDKQNPEKASEYDTYPQGQEHSTGSYKGAWGVYPFLQNNFVAVSDRVSGLVMLKYTRSILKNNYIFSSPEESLSRKITILLHFTEAPQNLLVKKDTSTLSTTVIDETKHIYSFAYLAKPDDSSSILFNLSFNGETHELSHQF